MLNSFHPGLLIIAIGSLILILPAKCRKPLALISAAVGIAGLFILSSSSHLVNRLTPALKMNLIKVDRLYII